MSTAKRTHSRRRQADARAASPTQPASKRLKTTKETHVPSAGASAGASASPFTGSFKGVRGRPSGLKFLVDEDARKDRKLEARLTNGVPGTKATRVDESRSVVAPVRAEEVGGSRENAVEISSAEESSSDDSSEEEEEEEEMRTEGNGMGGKGLANGHVEAGEEDEEDEEDAGAGAEMMDTTEDGPGREEEEAIAEPSFGDLLQARHPEQIDVRASFPDPMAERQALVSTSGAGPLALPTGTSLVTVLTQALKTNDKDQLEACFQQVDIPTIRSTVQRLQSQHVGTLLQRLAERIHKRPGRTGALLVWVQWSLVAHGAYLATQPDVMDKLRALSQVLRERASGLLPLLHLKGKLDMLAAQLDMRRSMQVRADADEEDDEEAVVYVEGQGDYDWSDDEPTADTRMTGAAANTNALEPPKPSSSKRPTLQTATPKTDPSDSEDDSDDDMPNGVAQEADDESSGNEEEEDEGMFDVEAEETPDDESEEAGSSEEEDSEPESESDVSEDDDESDEEVGVKPANPKMLNRKR